MEIIILDIRFAIGFLTVYFAFHDLSVLEKTDLVRYNFFGFFGLSLFNLFTFSVFNKLNNVPV